MAFRCCGKQGASKKAKNNEEELKKLADNADKHAVLTDMQELFKMFDANKNGLITKEEVLIAFKKMKIPILQEEILYIFMTYDSNGDNQLNYLEFSNMIKDLLQSKQYPVKDTFKYFDADDDGFITVEEFFTALRCLGVDITEEKAKELMTPYFSPETEKIDYDSFLKLMKVIVI